MDQTMNYNQQINIFNNFFQMNLNNRLMMNNLNMNN